MPCDEFRIAGFCLALQLFDIAELSESLAVAFDGWEAKINCAGGLSVCHAGLQAAVFGLDGIEIPEGDVSEDHIAESLVDFSEFLALGFFELQTLELIAGIEFGDIGCDSVAMIFGWLRDTWWSIAV
jgi:hypothetical protein